MKTWFITGISRGLGRRSRRRRSLGATPSSVRCARLRRIWEVGHGTLHVLTVDLTDAAAIARL